MANLKIILHVETTLAARKLPDRNSVLIRTLEKALANYIYEIEKIELEWGE